MNIENKGDLPEKYQRQVEKKLGNLEGPARLPKPNKYRNQQTVVNGIKFDSKKEAARYEVLMEQLRNGEISDLRLQVNFTIIEGFTAPTGDRIKPMKYIADFTYRDSEGKLVVEDVKSAVTRKDKAYRMKNKLMADKFGIIITEV